MSWNTKIIDSEILAIHIALVPNGDDGEVLLFGGDEHWSAQTAPPKGNGQFKKTRLYDVRRHDLVRGITIDSPETDVFCSGHAFTGDGRLLIAGGTTSFSVNHGHGLDFGGHRECWLWNAYDRKWLQAAQLLPDPNGDGTSGGGRWYPGAVTMGNGEVMALFGHVTASDTRHRNATPERYSVQGNAWWSMSKLANDGPNYRPFEGNPVVRPLFFARTFQLPDGRLFFATGMPVNWASNTTSVFEPPPTDGDHFSTFYQPSTGQYAGTPIPEAPEYTGWSFPCVMLPLLPTENYRVRIMHCGASQARRIDLGLGTPVWDPINTALGRNRINSCAVLLPTGNVCLVGGVESQENDQDQVNPAEIYNAQINWSTGQYPAGLGVWTADAASPTKSRNYHSAALLLPNGSVLTCGGNKNGDSGNPDMVGIKAIEVYNPDYGSGTRPTISDVPSSATYGQQFNVTVSNAASVQRVALLRNGSCTHAYDFDQRYVGVPFEYNPGDGHIRVTLAFNGNVAPPGYYMLWVIDTAGRPCATAKFIRLGFQSMTVITNRSTFSREEVDALGNGGVATFNEAIFVQFDGFTHTELSGIPTFEARWNDGNAVINATEITFTGGVRLQEFNPGSRDIPQRISFAFHVQFPNLNVYDTFTDTRQVNVTFRLGAFSASESLTLSHSPNPYLIDINAAQNNPSWLSTDVRVFSIQAGELKFGTVRQGTNDPIPFVRRCLDRLNDPENNGSSLFEGLSTAATISLATNGDPPSRPRLFNYAIARVRYRARTTTATRVKCFFRMFNVAATGLEFNTNTGYRRSPAPNSAPKIGLAGGEVASIPFFASDRVETVQGQPGATSMDDQTLDDTYEIQDIVPNAAGQEVTRFFGCWLDMNETRKRFPIALGGTDGPWPDAACRSIQELTRGRHMCIVGEIFFEPDPTQPGQTPDTSDNLSQRNLAILQSDNPGGPDSHTLMHTFEIKSSSIAAIRGPEPFPFPNQPYIDQRYRHDELLFRWRNLPPQSEVTVYFSNLSTQEIRTLAFVRRSPLPCEIIDQSTIKLTVGGATWIPIPGGRTLNLPALMSVKLPDTVKSGQVFRVTIHQVRGRDKKIIGSCEFRVEVSKAELILAEEASVFRHIVTTIPTDNRWYKLMQMYVSHLGVKVDALGGDSKTIQGNPDGSGRPYDPDSDGCGCGDRKCKCKCCEKNKCKSCRIDCCCCGAK
jgi:hypothetical protein